MTPSPSPDAARDLFQVSETGGTDVRKLAEQMATVRGLPETVLRYTQVFYRRVGEGLTDPTRAAVILGPRVVGHIAIMHRLANGLDAARLPNGVGQRLWSDCIHRALAARFLAHRTKAVNVDLAFTAGLALEWGVGPLLINRGQHLRWLAQVRIESGARRVRVEKELYGDTHMTAFDDTAREWGLPPWLVGIVHLHKTPVEDNTPVETAALQRICQWADSLAEAMTSPAAGPALEEVVRAAGSMGVHPDDAWRIVEAVLRMTPAAAEVLDVDVSPQPTIDNLKSRTGDYKSLHDSEWAALVQQENDRLRAELSEARAALDRAAREDPLTRLPTMNTFIDLCESAVHRCHVDGTGATLILVDLDDFTEINGRHTMHTGDKLLVHVAKRLRGVTQADNILGRVAGNTFAILVPGDVRTGQVIGERARACVEALHLDTGSTRIEVTATVVGVSLDEITETTRAEDLVTTAYRHAKAAGTNVRNRVVWSR